ncbi:MAG: hypothetical protein ACTSXC_07460 [Candidatus Freyarchaeota archaeon]
MESKAIDIYSLKQRVVNWASRRGKVTWEELEEYAKSIAASDEVVKELLIWAGGTLLLEPYLVKKEDTVQLMKEILETLDKREKRTATLGELQEKFVVKHGLLQEQFAAAMRRLRQSGHITILPGKNGEVKVVRVK